MLLNLLDQFHAKPENTWFVGEKASDIKCVKNASCKPALVLTGYGKKTLQLKNINADFPVFDDLAHFVDDLLS